MREYFLTTYRDLKYKGYDVRLSRKHYNKGEFDWSMGFSRIYKDKKYHSDYIIGPGKPIKLWWHIVKKTVKELDEMIRVAG